MNPRIKSGAAAPEELYYVRMETPDEPADGFVGRGSDGLPFFTWSPTMPLPEDDAERLSDDAARVIGGTLRLEPVLT